MIVTKRPPCRSMQEKLRRDFPILIQRKIDGFNAFLHLSTSSFCLNAVETT